MISEKEVKHIAELARIGLADKEVKKMQKELFAILDYIDLLKEIGEKNKGEIKKEGLIENTNITREDAAKSEPPEVVSKLTEAGPQKEKGYFKVKPVLRSKKR